MKKFGSFLCDETTDELGEYFKKLKKQLKDVENMIFKNSLVTFEEIMFNKKLIEFEEDDNCDFSEIKKLRTFEQDVLKKKDLSDLYYLRNKLEVLLEAVSMEICERELR